MSTEDSGGKARTAGAPPSPESLSPNQWKRRRRIIDATIQLLADRPYELIQMRDVAAESAVALGTVYRYFVSKEHLFGEVLASWSDLRLQRSRDEASVGENNPHERIHRVIRQMFRAFERYPNYIAVVLVLEGTTDVHAKAAYAVFTERSRETMATALHGIEEADVYPVVDVVSAVLAFVLRRWMLGFIDMEEARAIQERSLDVVFGQPRTAE